MTIIAVDVRAGLMVGDTQVSGEGGGAEYHTPKIFEAVDGSLVGASGNNTPCQDFLAWARAGAKGKLKVVSGDLDFAALRLTPDRRLFVWMGSLTPDEALNPVLAIGSGRDAFQAAYLAGASVPGAVAIACAVDPGCGLPTTILRLGGEE